MNASSKVKAVIVAAGKGSRFGASMPKQFCDLAGRPVLMTTIDRMAEAVGRDSVVIVLDATMISFWHELCAKHRYITPTIAIGGTTRWESVRNAIDRLGDEDDDTTVMIHDGARPLASAQFLRRMAKIDEDVDGMIPAVKVTDSLREVDGEKSEATDRSRFVAVQTPQVFRLATLREAYSLPYQPTMTDDASVVEAAGYTRLRLAEGESTNIKITNPLDIAIAEAIISRT